jgi:hypothetical protein
MLRTSEQGEGEAAQTKHQAIAFTALWPVLLDARDVFHRGRRPCVKPAEEDGKVTGQGT